MSSSDHGPGQAAAGHHDDHHDAFDPEPVQELGADETPSPGWLPVVGGGAFLVAAMWFFYPGANAPKAAPVEAAPPAAASVAPPAARATAATRNKATAPKPSGTGITRRMLDVRAGDKKKAPPTPKPQRP